MMDEPKQPAAVANGTAAGEVRDIVINARFLPNGLVDTITHRPDQLSPQEWFDRLCYAAPPAYQPLAGGRGAFRIPSDVLDTIRSGNATV
jgi:hypothetical protein